MRIHIKHWGGGFYFCYDPIWNTHYWQGVLFLSYRQAWELAFDMLKRRGA